MPARASARPTDDPPEGPERKLQLARDSLQPFVHRPPILAEKQTWWRRKKGKGVPVDELSVSHLERLGFKKETARNALVYARNDVAMAIELAIHDTHEGGFNHKCPVCVGRSENAEMRQWFKDQDLRPIKKFESGMVLGALGASRATLTAPRRRRRVSTPSEYHECRDGGYDSDESFGDSASFHPASRGQRSQSVLDSPMPTPVLGSTPVMGSLLAASKTVLNLQGRNRTTTPNASTSSVPLTQDTSPSSPMSMYRPNASSTSMPITDLTPRHRANASSTSIPIVDLTPRHRVNASTSSIPYTDLTPRHRGNASTSSILLHRVNASTTSIPLADAASRHRANGLPAFVPLNDTSPYRAKAATTFPAMNESMSSMSPTSPTSPYRAYSTSTSPTFVPLKDGRHRPNGSATVMSVNEATATAPFHPQNYPPEARRVRYYSTASRRDIAYNADAMVSHDNISTRDTVSSPTHVRTPSTSSFYGWYNSSGGPGAPGTDSSRNTPSPSANHSLFARPRSTSIGRAL